MLFTVKDHEYRYYQKIKENYRTGPVNGMMDSRRLPAPFDFQLVSGASSLDF